MTRYTGSLIITIEAKSEKQARAALMELANKLNESGAPVIAADFDDDMDIAEA